MIANPLTQVVDRIFGRGRYAVTVPSMDGALQPNAALDNASVLARGEELDNAVACGGALFYTTRDTVWRSIPGADAEVAHRLQEPATALAASPGGRLAVALTSGTIVLFGSGEPVYVRAAAGAGLKCVTALEFVDDDHMVLANGSATRTQTQWQRDLMERNSSGSVWKLDLRGDRIERLVGGLAYPGGLLLQGDSVVVAESWRHRLLRQPLRGGSAVPTTANLPGYPGRMTRDANGAPCLCIFAPRSQLVEFVLREPRYRSEMIRTIAPEYWIAPSYRSGDSFAEPLQGGGVKQMGTLKPWAPTRSYGLVVKLDADLQPTASFHSRSDGRRHGITSVAACANGLAVTSRGTGELLLVPDDALAHGDAHAATH